MVRPSSFTTLRTAAMAAGQGSPAAEGRPGSGMQVTDSGGTVGGGLTDGDGEGTLPEGVADGDGVTVGDGTGDTMADALGLGGGAGAHAESISAASTRMALFTTSVPLRGVHDKSRTRLRHVKTWLTGAKCRAPGRFGPRGPWPRPGTNAPRTGRERGTNEDRARNDVPGPVEIAKSERQRRKTNASTSIRLVIGPV